ncbi:MAG: type II toxin-antitoxin system VapC family toxin [Trueperaceae bacterium]|nr:type II toxin-antitoxin system VapC family toxin [Trueperaceae bacterium]
MYLLDTHTLFWLDTDPKRLSATALSLIKDKQNIIYTSSINAWELSIKFRLGKLPSAKPLLTSYHSSLARYGFRELSFTSHHALAEQTLSSEHKDPFDRGLVAQALIENLGLISNDPLIQGFTEIKTIW